MKKLIIYSLGLLTCYHLHAQVPVPAPDQAEPILLKGATIHLGNGEVIENGNVGFDKGLITMVSSEAVDVAGYKVIDSRGKHIYPGFILVNTPLGISEVSSVRAMSDHAEQGEYNPNVRSQIAYNTDSENIPAFRFNGILLAESTPAGGIVSGTSSVMELEGWNWEDATHTKDVAIHLNWPERMRGDFDYNTYTYSRIPNEKYDEEIAGLEKLFDEAKGYLSLSHADKNIKLEAMRGLFDGSQLLVVHTDQAKTMVESIKFARERGVQRVAIAGGDETLHIAGFLAENKVPVIIPAPHRVPERDDDDYDLPYKLGALLTQKGVSVTLSHEGMLGNSRNLPFYAGTVVAHGLGKEEALKMITSNPAAMLGISDRVGTLEKGKEATLFISEGDALDMRTNNLIRAFIKGKEITLDGRQQWLYKKYSEKYGH